MAVFEVSKNENAADPVEVYQKLQERERKEAELSAHRFTLAEVQGLEAKAYGGDLEAMQEYKALSPWISASNSRGDFRYPWQFSRAEAQAYIKERGVSGPVWSLREVRAISSDPHLWETYRDILHEANEAGALITGPNSGRGQIYHFRDESDEAFAKELYRKLAFIDQRRAAEKTIAETLEMLPEIKKAGIPRHYLDVQLAKIWRDDTDWYPVDQLAGYGDLQNAFFETGAGPSDERAIMAAVGRARHNIKF